MKTIRNATFETNSSSTHALVILSKQEYEDFCNDKVALNLRNGNIVPLNKNYYILYKLMYDYIIYNKDATQE